MIHRKTLGDVLDTLPALLVERSIATADNASEIGDNAIIDCGIPHQTWIHVRTQRKMFRLQFDSSNGRLVAAHQSLQVNGREGLERHWFSL